MPLIACQTNTQQKQQTTPQPKGCAARRLIEIQNSKAITTKTGTTHPQHLVKHCEHCMCDAKDARVHYPTINHPTHQHHPPTTPTHVRDHHRQQRKRQPTPPPNSSKASEECDSSKPNSVPHPTHTHPIRGSTPTTQSAGAVLTSQTPTRGAFIDDSTSEQHHQAGPNDQTSMAD